VAIRLIVGSDFRRNSVQKWIFCQRYAHEPPAKWRREKHMTAAQKYVNIETL
jgi:hypothetical protein